MANDEELKSVKEEVAILRDLTRRTGILHETQVINLKYWPYVLFEISRHEILPDDLRRVLTFNLCFTKRKPKNLKELCQTLESWCWNLLGPEYMIRVRDSRSGKYLYHGTRGVTWTPPQVEGAEKELTFEQLEEEDAAERNDGHKRRGKRGRAKAT